MSDTQKFLARVLPWPQNGEAGYCNIHHSFKPVGYNPLKPPFSGQAFTDVKHAAEFALWKDQSPGTLDMYFCMSRQSEAVAATYHKSGKPYFKAVKSAVNVLALKSFAADIDVKEGAFASTGEAVAAIKSFVDKTGIMVPNVIVGSGSGGLHIYWVLSEAIDYDAWAPLAHALVAAMLESGIHFDTQCTTDAARILRIPGTSYRKYNKATQAHASGSVKLLAMREGDYSLDRMQAVLAPWIGKTAVPPRPTATPAPQQDLKLDFTVVATHPIDAALNAELSGGIQNDGPDLDACAAECPWLTLTLAKGAASNPEWNLTTLLSTFTRGGVADAHRLAQASPKYNAEDTDALFDRKSNEKALKNLGWPSCAAVASPACDQCPKKALGRTPLHLKVRVPPATPNPATPAPPAGGGLPAGYVRNRDGVILHTVKDSDGNTAMVPICNYQFANAWLQPHPWTLNFTTQGAHGDVQVSLPFEVVASKDSLPKALGRYSMMMHDYELKATKEFLVSWIQMLRTSKESVVNTLPFGWYMEEGKAAGFVYGGKCIGMSKGAKFERQASVPDPVIARQYEPKGAITPWVEAARIITDQKRQDLAAILASTFGAPLVGFTGQSGLLMVAHSPESGLGKSTTLKIAQAVWGHPVGACQALDDTQNSVINKTGILKALPMFWDEIKTEEQSKKFASLAFQISQGKEKGRLQSSSQQKESGTWQTMLIACSNESILEHILKQTKNSTAGLYRCFEFKVKPKASKLTNSEVSRKISSLEENYGQVGLRYAEFLGLNAERVNAEVGQMMDMIEKRVKASQDERFWVSLVAIIIMGAKYANEIGVTDFDVPELYRFMLKTLGELRAERMARPVDMGNAMNVGDVLGRFLGEMRATHTLRTNRVHVGRGRPAQGAVKVVGDPTRLQTIHVQWGVDDGVIRIDANRLVDWLDHNHYSRSTVIDAMKASFGMRHTNSALGAGTEYASMSQYLFELHAQSVQLKPLIEGFDVPDITEPGNDQKGKTNP